MRLNAKLLLLFAAASALSIWVLSVSSRRAVHSVLIAKLQAPARAKAAQIGRSVAIGLSPGGDALLSSYLDGCVSAFGVDYALAVDRRGKVVADTRRRLDERTVDEAFLREALSSGRPAWAERAGPEPALELALPSQEPRGALVLAYPLADVLATERQIALKVALFSGSAAAGGLLLLLLLTRSLVARFGEMRAELARTTVSKDYLSEILSGMIDALFVVGSDRAISLVNPAALRLLGYSEGEFLGRPASRVFSEEDDPFSAGGIERLFGGAPIANRELSLRRKDGTKVCVLLSASRLTGPDGLPSGILCAARDVSELKRSAEALRRSEDQLRVSDRLSAVGRLAAGIAHEINNPLGSILGFAQAAARKIKRAGVLAPALVGIEEEARRCRALVQNLLTFSRHDPGESRCFDLGEAVTRSLSLIAPQARLRSVRLEPRLEPGALVLGNRSQLQQVVVNLCSNAIDAMPDGGRLELRTSRAGARALLEVEDSGAGIAPEALEHVFDPFFTTKEPGKGTGLGLSLVHEIATKHRGGVEVESRPGRTVFRVWLPAA